MSAYKDENGKSTMTGVLISDGSTIKQLKANPSTGGLKVSDGTTGAYIAGHVAKTDDNGVPTLMAVSYLDPTVIVLLSTDSNGNLLIKTT